MNPTRPFTSTSLRLLLDLKCEGVALGLRHNLDLVFRDALRGNWLGRSFDASPLDPVQGEFVFDASLGVIFFVLPRCTSLLVRNERALVGRPEQTVAALHGRSVYC